MRKYVHFLGFSSSEGGVVEIKTNDTFDMGAVDIETMEQEFDDFSFTVPFSDCFLTKPIYNEAWNVLTVLKGKELTVLNACKFIGDRQLNVGEYLWIENERVKINAKNVYGSSILYAIGRAQNGSIGVVHIPNVGKGQGYLTATKKRISPIGMIVKIFDNDKTIVYGQITGVKLTNSSAVEVTCSNIYKQMENTVIVKNDWGNLTLRLANEYGVNEFFSLLDVPNLKVNPEFIGELSESDARFTIYSKTKDSLTQILNINNSFLRFENGRFNILYIGRTANKQATTLKLSDHFAINDGVIEFSLIAPYSSAKINDGVNEEYSIDAFDSNFTRAYTLAKTIDISLDALKIVGDLSLIGREIAIDKLWFLNNVTEMLSITSYRHEKFFQVGEYYNFVDIFKYVSFYNVVTDRIFLCISYDDGKVTFMRTPAAVLSYVAPSLIVKKIGTSEFEIVNILKEIDGVDSETEIITCQLFGSNNNNLETLKNNYTNTLFFESGDIVTFIDVDNTLYSQEINTVSELSFTTTVDFGYVNDLFIVTIQSDVVFPLLAEKNKVYLYENNGAF